MANGSIRMHKTMAETGKASGRSVGDSFGCESFTAMNQGHINPDHGKDGGTLEEGSRANPPHVGRGSGSMPATAHSDHGPHNLHGQERRAGGGMSLREVQ
jgi:hypothetical protein